MIIRSGSFCSAYQHLRYAIFPSIDFIAPLALYDELVALLSSEKLISWERNNKASSHAWNLRLAWPPILLLFSAIRASPFPYQIWLDYTTLQFVSWLSFSTSSYSSVPSKSQDLSVRKARRLVKSLWQSLDRLAVLLVYSALQSVFFRCATFQIARNSIEEIHARLNNFIDVDMSLPLSSQFDNSFLQIWLLAFWICCVQTLTTNLRSSET